MGVHITFVRSCDLDEWTSDQLEIMKLSGNGNASLFFKKHGVTEDMMRSEKKYKTKAATEYKRHLQKLLQESHGILKSPSVDANDHSTSSNVTDIDSMMKSLEVNSKNLNQTTPLASVGHLNPATPVVTSQPVEARGSLSVDVLTSEANLESQTSETNITASMNKLSKRPTISKKIGAKKMSTSSTDVKLETFEALEKRKIQESMQLKMSSPTNASVSSGEKAKGSHLLSAIYEESQRSLYETSKNAKNVSSIATPAVTATKTAQAESYEARSKYANVKSISSDQFFGRDSDAVQESRLKLQQLSGSNAISSDMIYNSDSHEDTEENYGFSNLKESISGFFSGLG